MKSIGRVVTIVCVALMVSAGAWAQLTKGFRGRVLDMQGKGIPDVTVTLVDEDNPGNHYELKTDKSGSFVQTGLPFSDRGYKITAQPPGLPSIIKTEKPKLGDVTDIIMDPRKDLTFQGSVKDKAGKSLTGVKVTVVNLADEAAAKSVKTDGKGRYKCDGLPFSEKGYRITAEIPGEELKSKNVGVSTIGPLEISFDPTMTSDSATGDSQGSSAAQAAKQLYDLGDFEGAVAKADATIEDLKEAPENRKAARLIKAKSLQKLNHTDDAIGIFEQVYKENPNDVNVLGEIIQLYEAKGDKAKADAYKKEFQAKGGKVMGEAYNDGVKAFNDGEMDKAAGFFEKALQEDPNDFDAERQLGIVYGATSQFEKAMPHLEKYLKVKPDAADKGTVQAVLQYCKDQLSAPPAKKK